jgi:sigma-B regulation protein RsbU (phosphoserine phosphatase)
MSNNAGQLISDLERENRILKRKLHRSQRNRELSEESKDMSDTLYHTVINDLDAKNNELERMSSELEQAYQIIKAQKERMEDELNVGRQIQMSMLPLEFPAFPERNEFSLYAAVKPAREVGGDFYDFFFIDDDRLCFCIGDVSDKGVPAALFMAVTKTLIESTTTSTLSTSTANILTRVNDSLSRDNSSCMFVTIFLGILNVKTGQLVYTNAGHNPPFLLRGEGRMERLDSCHGLVVGALSSEKYQEEETTLSSGDILFMYTDGVTEARNPQRELYSEHRLVDLISSHKNTTVEGLVNSTVSDVDVFQSDAIQADDVTLLVIKIH